MTNWLLSGVFCVAVSWLAVDAEPEDLTMTIPHTISTHWFDTVPLVHAISADHDAQMEDWLHLGEMPAPVSAEIAERPPEPAEHRSMLLSLIEWLLGPRP